MLADQSFAGGVVDAVDAVAGDIAVPPLDVRIHGGEDRVRMLRRIRELLRRHRAGVRDIAFDQEPWHGVVLVPWASGGRSEEHTSELQSLMRTSYAVFCL